jgi:hypothetical protein
MVCEALPTVGSPIVLLLVGVMGLLDEQDEADGLNEAITSNMEPNGSPLKSVSAVDFNPNIKDGLSCPELTNVLIFESPHEMHQVFRSKLLSIVPDLLLAFRGRSDRKRIQEG